MEAEQIFTADGAWEGGEFGMLLIYDRCPDDHLRAALTALCSQPALHGCFEDSSVEAARQTAIAPIVAARELDRSWYGVTAMPNGARVPCRSRVYRWEEGESEIWFGVPMGSLGRIYPVGSYPIADGRPLHWRVEVSDWFVRIAEAVYAECPFRFGMIDHDVAIEPSDVRAVPDERWEGYLWPENGRLRWYPQNKKSPIGLFSRHS